MSELTVSYRTSVTPDQIDQLGHMNVRFYGINARHGTAATLEDLGHGGWSHELHDTYTRHHHEQLLGAELEVRSAVVGVSPTTLELYHELRNSESDDLAATFVHRLTAPKALGPNAPLPNALIAAATERVTSIPAQGKPRTVTLDGPMDTTAPSIETLLEKGCAIRKPRVITGQECDESGFYAVDTVPDLIWGGEPFIPREDPDDWLIDLPTGERMGWAAMENRTVVLRLPKAGDQVQSFGATLSLADKVSHRIYVVYDVERRDLLVMSEGVSLAFDINARKAMSIPDSVRQEEDSQLLPELFGRPSSR